VRGFNGAVAGEMGCRTRSQQCTSRLFILAERARASPMVEALRRNPDESCLRQLEGKGWGKIGNRAAKLGGNQIVASSTAREIQDDGESI